MTTPRSKADDVLALNAAIVDNSAELTAATAALAAATNDADRKKALRRIDVATPRAAELALDIVKARSATHKN
jgi:hypothetical protein